MKPMWCIRQERLSHTTVLFYPSTKQIVIHVQYVLVIKEYQKYCRNHTDTCTGIAASV